MTYQRFYYMGFDIMLLYKGEMYQTYFKRTFTRSTGVDYWIFQDPNGEIFWETWYGYNDVASEHSLFKSKDDVINAIDYIVQKYPEYFV